MNRNQPPTLDLSIIVPVYQVEQYIRPCIESIFKQGLDDDRFEVIIVNDGTKDHSMEVIADIISLHDNITVINQESQGSWVARNTGMSKASGEYLLFVDSDDLLIDHSLKPLLEKALKSKTDILVADYLEMNDEEIDEVYRNPPHQKDFTIQEKTGEQLFLEDLNPYHCYIWRSLFRKAFLQDNHLTFNTEFFFQDVPFLHECYIMANKCQRVSWLLNIYRRGHESATHSFTKEKILVFCAAIAKTWDLTHLKGLTPAVLHKIQDDVYISFSHMVRKMCYYVKSSSNRNELIDYLMHETPDLIFKNGKKQMITSFFLRKMPHTYIQLRFLYCNYVENQLLPYYRHHIKRR